MRTLKVKHLTTEFIGGQAFSTYVFTCPHCATILPALLDPQQYAALIANMTSQRFGQ